MGGVTSAPDEGRGEVAEQRACREALVRDAAALVSVVSMVSVGSMVRVVHGECSKHGECRWAYKVEAVERAFGKPG